MGERELTPKEIRNRDRKPELPDDKMPSKIPPVQYTRKQGREAIAKDTADKKERQARQREAREAGKKRK